MTGSGINWGKILSTASGAIFASSAISAHAAQQHIVKPGDNLSSIARKYHVAVQDIVAANHLSNVDALKEGSKLTVPPPPRKQFVKASMHRSAAIHGDRISIRMTPSVDGRRIDMFDMGTPLTVTANKEGWYQVTLNDGRKGWIRQDYVKFAGAVSVAHTPVAPASRRSVKLAHTSSSSHRSSHVAQMRHASRQHFAAASHASKRRHSRGNSIANIKVAPGSDVVRTAYAYRGTPYHYGGTGRGGFDCSGFTSYIYRQKGVSLPHNAAAQFAHGSNVSKSELKPGDLVFFHCGRRGISHVGIFVGNGKFVHASSPHSGGVRVDSLNDGYYKSTFRGARRVKK